MISHGLSMTAFWMGHFLADLVEYYLFSLGLSVGVLALVGTELSLGKLVLLLSAYGPAAIAQAYLLFVVIPNPTLLQIINTVLNMLIGSILPIVAYLVENFKTENFFVSVLLPACKSVPSFVLGQGLLQLLPTPIIPMLSSAQSGISESVLILVGLGFTYWVTALAIDHMVSVHALRRLKFSAEPLPPVITSEDETVARERDAVSSHRTQVLRLRSVSKQYSSSDPWAVNQVPLGLLPTGEVFGLLGQNSAGKSTLLKMSTGEILPTYGDVEYSRNQTPLNTRRHMNACRKMMGYCPQADLVAKDLNVREILLFYGRIKGVGMPKVLSVSDQLDLTRYLDSPAKTLSGG